MWEIKQSISYQDHYLVQCLGGAVIFNSIVNNTDVYCAY